MLTLAERLDGAQALAIRSAALAQLARQGQSRIDAFFLKRGVNDADDRADLCAMVMETLTIKVLRGDFQAARCQSEMGYVLGIAARVLAHYRSRDRRLLGQIVTLDETFDDGEECADLYAIEEALDREQRLERLVERLDTETAEIARRIWADGYDPSAIAAALQRNIKTIRTRIRVIAHTLRALRDEEER